MSNDDHTHHGDTVHGDKVGADKVGRDHIYGDKVGGDVVIRDQYNSPRYEAANRVVHGNISEDIVITDYNEEPQISSNPTSSPANETDTLAGRYKLDALRKRFHREHPEQYKDNLVAIQHLISQRNEIQAELIELRSRTKELDDELRISREENIRIVTEKSAARQRNLVEASASLVLIVIMGAGVELMTSDSYQVLGGIMVAISLLLEGFFLYQRFREMEK